MYRAKVYGVAGFERQFAVKRFHPELVALPIVSQRLSAAARAYGSLEHPRIARLHEYGVASGEVFTATEMVPGLDVMRLVAATHGAGVPLPPGAALSLVTQAARAVGYAHGRGVNHLGLCPTNVIVTPEGDVKITDFGILAQTMTIRASDDDRLQLRIHHLAPEQLVGEGTSAATDVFALGALLHELVTGERAFVGVTPLDVEHAILSGHVRDAGLPKAMARVLARCFARSPFERFPDARALADAIDAALRVAPVVGGRRELGGIVKEAVARLEAMNEGHLSGAMVLAMPMPPSSGRLPTTEEKTALRDPVRPAPANPMAQTMRGTGRAGAGPAPKESGAPGARPSIDPVPRRAPSTRPPSIGVPAVIPPRPGRTVPPPAPGTLTAALAPRAHPVSAPPPQPIIPEESDEHTIQREPVRRGANGQLSPAGVVPSAPSRMPNASPLPFSTPAPELERDIPTREIERPSPAPALRLDTAWPTEEVSAIPDGAEPLVDESLRPSEPVISVTYGDDSEGVPVVPEVPIAPAAAPPSFERQAVADPPATPLSPPQPSGAGSRGGTLKTTLFLIVCAAVGIGGVLAWNTWLRDRGEARADRPPTVAASTAAERVDQPGAAPADDDPDQGPAVAAPVVDEPVAPPPTALVIDSTPAGATVFVDGADQGETPVTLPPSADRHSIAVVLAGHDLYTAEIDGAGTHHAKLTEITPPNGPAGIKVKCDDKNRYYVYVDGKPTGQLCPTERIGVALGEHTVEVYDLVSEERREYPARVKETRNSLRVRVD